MKSSIFAKASSRDIPRAAIFLSGSGSNAIKLLESLRGPAKGAWTVAALATDRPKTSAAAAIAARFGLSDRLVELDIAEFYKERGETRVSLATEKGRSIREEWTASLRRKLAPFAPDFGVLAGFVPLCNIAGDFPCLNVHPGDLTYEKDGRRVLAGLHTIPIENAILEGLDSLRSSVILAQPYTGSGDEEMDSGPVLGVSRPMPIDFHGHERAELLEAYAKRPERRPPGGFKDVMAEVAALNQDALKEHGDWTVLPPVVEAFAKGRYALDEAGTLLWACEDGDLKVKTVEFGAGAARPVKL